MGPRYDWKLRKVVVKWKRKILVHRPSLEERGDIRTFYAIFKLDNGGYHFEIMTKSYVDAYAARYSKAYDTDFSPWKSNYEGMAKKTVIKQLLKYAPMKSDFQKAVSMDETIKAELSVDMSEVQNQEVIDLDDATQLILEAAGLGRHAPTSIRRMYIRLICLRKT
jgi:recombination protein RecT